MQRPPGPEPSRHPTLCTARAFTLARLAQAQAALTALSGELSALETVLVGGSLGRLEAHADSDVDCVLIAKAEAAPAARAVAAAQVIEVFAALGFKAPKVDGIYRQTIARAELLDPAAHGSLDEAAPVFGKRMQVLLDARAVYRTDALAALRRDVLAWYSAGFIDLDPRRGWTALINDTTRYLHAYAGWQQFRLARSSDDSWSLRQRKLRSSRLLTFAGLLVLLGESNARADKRAWLLERLPLTPTERLGLVMCRYDPHAYAALLDAYEITQRALGDPAMRRAMRDGGPESLDTLDTLDQSAASAAPAIQAAERRLSQVLSGFLLARRQDWDPRFFERLLL